MDERAAASHRLFLTETWSWRRRFWIALLANSYPASTGTPATIRFVWSPNISGTCNTLNGRPSGDPLRTASQRSEERDERSPMPFRHTGLVCGWVASEASDGSACERQHYRQSDIKGAPGYRRSGAGRVSIVEPIAGKESDYFAYPQPEPSSRLMPRFRSDRQGCVVDFPRAS